MFRRMIFLGCLLLSACGQHPSDPNTIKIGTIAGPETQLMEVAKKVAQRNELTLKIVTFTHYPMPNAALNEGSIDANMFQHLPYLNADKKAHGYQISVLGKTFIYPMAIYSKKWKRMADVPLGAKVGVPNDPSNQARALLLLAKAGMIRLKPGVTQPSKLDIQENLKQLDIKALDAAQLPRLLSDLDIAAINTNWAIPAGLMPKRDGLFLESKDSPYANLVVVRTDELKQAKYIKLMKALHSREVLKAADNVFQGQAIPAW